MFLWWELLHSSLFQFADSWNVYIQPWHSSLLWFMAPDIPHTNGVCVCVYLYIFPELGPVLPLDMSASHLMSTMIAEITRYCSIVICWISFTLMGISNITLTISWFLMPIWGFSKQNNGVGCHFILQWVLFYLISCLWPASNGWPFGECTLQYSQHCSSYSHLNTKAPWLRWTNNPWKGSFGRGGGVWNTFPFWEIEHLMVC